MSFVCPSTSFQSATYKEIIKYNKVSKSKEVKSLKRYLRQFSDMLPRPMKTPIQHPKFADGPEILRLFSDDIFPRIKVVDIVSNNKWLFKDCTVVLKCFAKFCSRFVYLTKIWRS
jgi:hypothetical protein